VTAAATANRCHAAVQKALRDGDLTQLPCEVCGSTSSIAHHDDYRRPLDVRWMCRRHHGQWHAANPTGIEWPGSPVLSVRLSGLELDKLREIALEEQRTVANVLRLALREFISGRQK
jgi:hypothetical protein